MFSKARLRGIPPIRFDAILCISSKIGYSTSVLRPDVRKKRIGGPVNECFVVICETELHTSRAIKTFPFPKDVLPLLLTLYLTRSSVISNRINQMAVNIKPSVSKI